MIACVPGSAKAQAIAGVANQARRAFDQMDHRSIRNAALWTGKIASCQADLLQQPVDGKPTSPQVLNDKAGHAGVGSEPLPWSVLNW